MRNVRGSGNSLSGILSDGSSFSFGSGTFESGSIVTVIVAASISEPSSALLLGGMGILLSIRRRRSVVIV